jgi:hypothetical protein
MDRFDVYYRQIVLWDDNDLERAFNSARKLYQEKLPQYETFYDYKKSLIKK